jgi:hypothetical protein
MQKDETMVQHLFARLAALLGLVTVVAGCAGHLDSAVPVSAAVGSTSDLSGTWHGSYGQIAPSLYSDDGKAVLQINDDGTFTATVTPGYGANNRAKPERWTGTVVTRGNRIILESSRARWPWLTLTRSNDGILYGVTTDPAIEGPVAITFERDGLPAH